MPLITTSILIPRRPQDTGAQECFASVPVVTAKLTKLDNGVNIKFCGWTRWPTRIHSEHSCSLSVQPMVQPTHFQSIFYIINTPFILANPPVTTMIFLVLNLHQTPSLLIPLLPASSLPMTTAAPAPQPPQPPQNSLALSISFGFSRDSEYPVSTPSRFAISSSNVRSSPGAVARSCVCVL